MASTILFLKVGVCIKLPQIRGKTHCKTHQTTFTPLHHPGKVINYVEGYGDLQQEN